MEQKIKNINEWYPEFIRNFGEILATVGSIGQALDAVLRSDFGPIQKYVISLKNRIKNKVDQPHGFELFSRDCGSEIVANGNQVISTALDKGGDMNITGNTVANITIKINELRGKRAQTVKTFETIIIVLHVLTLGVFGLMNKLTSIFFELMSSIEITTNAFPLSPIDPGFMEMILPIMILMTSVLSAAALMVSRGGLYKTVFFHIALLAVLGSMTVFAMDILMTDFLEASILDFGDTGA